MLKVPKNQKAKERSVSPNVTTQVFQTPVSPLHHARPKSPNLGLCLPFLLILEQVALSHSNLFLLLQNLEVQLIIPVMVIRELDHLEEEINQQVLSLNPVMKLMKKELYQL